jgi:hypothetical protein
MSSLNDVYLRVSVLKADAAAKRAVADERRRLRQQIWEKQHYLPIGEDALRSGLMSLIVPFETLCGVSDKAALEAEDAARKAELYLHAILARHGADSRVNRKQDMTDKSLELFRRLQEGNHTQTADKLAQLSALNDVRTYASALEHNFTELQAPASIFSDLYKYTAQRLTKLEAAIKAITERFAVVKTRLDGIEVDFGAPLEHLETFAELQSRSSELTDVAASETLVATEKRQVWKDLRAEVRLLHVVDLPRNRQRAAELEEEMGPAEELAKAAEETSRVASTSSTRVNFAIHALHARLGANALSEGCLCVKSMRLFNSLRLPYQMILAKSMASLVPPHLYVKAFASFSNTFRSPAWTFRDLYEHTAARLTRAEAVHVAITTRLAMAEAQVAANDMTEAHDAHLYAIGLAAANASGTASGAAGAVGAASAARLKKIEVVVTSQGSQADLKAAYVATAALLAVAEARLAAFEDAEASRDGGTTAQLVARLAAAELPAPAASDGGGASSGKRRRVD